MASRRPRNTLLPARPTIFDLLFTWSNVPDLRRHATSTKILAPTYDLYAAAGKRLIQRIIVATSTCTILLVLVTFFFFLRMPQKRLRHKLVMLSIFGCLVRGLWYFIFSVVVVSGKTVATRSGLCQATGFFLHVGNEMSDIATLLIAIHGALQIFRPIVSALDTADGLYQWRHSCYIAIWLLPLIIASISFVNTAPAYTAQGAFCSLPTSPIWYRIVLSWAPRYLIALIIICLSTAVYVHVELKFRSFAKSQRASRTSIAIPVLHGNETLPIDISVPEASPPIERRPVQRILEPAPVLRIPDYGPRCDKNLDGGIETRLEQSLKNDGALTNKVMGPTEEAALPSRKVSIVTTGSRDTATTSNKSRTSLPGIATLKRTHSAIQKLTSPTPHVSPQLTALQKQAAERKALRRQLKLIFVYPVVYVVLWAFPMALNAMQYLSKYNTNLPMWLGAVSNVSLTLMGAIDCLVFLWREKPWRRARNHGSLARMSASSRTGDGDLEKGGDTSATGAERQASSTKILTAKSSVASAMSTLLPKRRSTTRSASTVAKQRAYERLALEIEDRRVGVRDSIDGAAHAQALEAAVNHPDAPATSRSSVKQWWDRQDSIW